VFSAMVQSKWLELFSTKATQGFWEYVFRKIGALVFTYLVLKEAPWRRKLTWFFVCLVVFFLIPVSWKPLYVLLTGKYSASDGMELLAWWVLLTPVFAAMVWFIWLGFVAIEKSRKKWWSKLVLIFMGLVLLLRMVIVGQNAAVNNDARGELLQMKQDIQEGRLKDVGIILDTCERAGERIYAPCNYAMIASVLKDPAICQKMPGPDEWRLEHGVMDKRAECILYSLRTEAEKKQYCYEMENQKAHDSCLQFIPRSNKIYQIYPEGQNP
jgi:hypothetical protein